MTANRVYYQRSLKYKERSELWQLWQVCQLCQLWHVWHVWHVWMCDMYDMCDMCDTCDTCDSCDRCSVTVGFLVFSRIFWSRCFFLDSTHCDKDVIILPPDLICVDHKRKQLDQTFYTSLALAKTQLYDLTNWRHYLWSSPAFNIPLPSSEGFFLFCWALCRL
jgi:hypothetical protein